MSLLEFVESVDSPDRSLVVVNRESPRPLQRMLEGMFEDQPVDVGEADVSEDVEDMVYLVEDDDIVATSSLVEIQESILLVNSDLYITGARGAGEVELPDVIEGLENVRFSLRGYPESNKEKFLLIVISRYIERIALDTGGGKHRASFQRLSRINDEQGTRAVYERLAETETDVHVYGMPDWTVPPEFGTTMHGGWSGDFRDSWFVVYVPDDEAEPHAALVAVETEPRYWDGFWTFDSALVRDINRYVEREL